MPILEMLDVAPMPLKVPAVELEQRNAYEGFIKRVADVEGKIGKLSLAEEEKVSSVRMRLSHAARRLEVPIRSWTAGGDVYFRVDATRKKD